jgi:hypothetical protein
MRPDPADTPTAAPLQPDTPEAVASFEKAIRTEPDPAPDGGPAKNPDLEVTPGHGYGCACSECYLAHHSETRSEVDAAFEKLKVRVHDNWQHRSVGMKCATCMWYVPKPPEYDLMQHPNAPTERIKRTFKVGRCRRRSPTMSGWPAMYTTDWCGDHKLDEEKLDEA